MNENELTMQVREAAASTVVITSDEEYSRAGEFLVSLKTKMKTVTEFFRESKQKAAEAHKAICASEKSLLDPLKQAETKCKMEMARYQDAERQRREIEARKQSEEQSQMAALSNEAEATGDVELAAEAMAEAMVAYYPGVAPKADGVAAKTVWKYEVVDANAIPREYLIVNESALSAVVKATKGTIRIPGIRVYQTTEISARAK